MIPLSHYEEAAAVIRSRMREPIDRAVILGSGLAGLTQEMTGATDIRYEDIPHFPRSTVETHAGKLFCGRLAGKPVMALSGRSHFYEGYRMDEVAFAVRVLYLLGVRHLIVTNAAGGVNRDFTPGNLMLITDHIQFGAESPSRGGVPSVFGERFFDMSRAYTPRLLDLARRCGQEQGIPLREGVYFFMPGPQYETPAEIRAIRTLGGDAVGMSTVGEVMAASQCGMEVLGISCITNMAAGILPDSTLNDAEVNQTAAKAGKRFRNLVKAVLADL